MTTLPDPYTVLTAVADHIHTNPVLADTVTSVSPSRAELQIYPVGRPKQPGRDFRLLTEWIGTLYDVAPAIVTTAPTDTNPRVHLDLYCQLHDGTTMTLIVLLDADESAWLADPMAGPLRVGDAVPVELLLRLAEVERVSDQVGGQFTADQQTSDTVRVTAETSSDEERDK